MQVLGVAWEISGVDDKKKPPVVLANHVIRQMVDHALAEDMVVTPEDFMAIRVTFRQCGGQWSSIMLGDIVHVELLSKIVNAWGKLPERKRETDSLV